jgi:hypothetical protein
MTKRTRGEILLDCIEEEVMQRLNPSGEDCPECGGDGYTYDCFEEFACIDPESGCADCERRCRWCVELKHDRLKAVREEVIKSSDPDIAIAWLKQIGRWHEGITVDQVKEQLSRASKPVSPADSTKSTQKGV